jgi:hypothetical protein
MTGVVETTGMKLPAKFLNTLSMERYGEPDSGKWILTKPLVYRSVVAGQTFIVPAGFVTDLASVPRLPVVYWLTGDTCDEAAVVHDYLYSTHMTTRAVADSVLCEASKVMGEPAWRCRLMWAGVRIGGGGADHWGRGDDNSATLTGTTDLS